MNTCSQYSKVPVGTLCPTQHRINADVVMTLIADTLRAIAAYSKNDRAEFVQTVKEAQVAQQSGSIAQKKKRLAETRKRSEELEKLLCQIYEDKILGKLPESRFATLDARYADEQDELSGEIEKLEQAVFGYEHKQQSTEKFIALIDKYESFDTLTTTMLNEFVEKIVVHERDHKGRQDTTQEVEIYFNFVGKYAPPHFGEVSLTPEEQEAMRKKEERRDRLHRNYLRRKANGRQREYEERVKNGKRQKIEAQKAALRAEDMAKGVFIPVSNLPKAEPKSLIASTMESIAASLHG